MNEEYEGLMIQEARKLVQDKMNRTGMVSRLIEFGITPKLTRWAFLKDGKPTLDWGIEYVKFIDKDTYCVGMYHLPTKRILISRLSFGPGGAPGLTRFAHQMDECQSADEFYERLPKLVEAFIAAKEEYDKATGAQTVNEYVRNCIQKTKTKMPDYFEKCLQQRLKNGIGSTTDCETVEEMESKLMSAKWSPWIDTKGVLSPCCKAFFTDDIPGYHGMLDIDQFPDDALCYFNDFKKTGFLSLCMKTDKRERVDFTILITGPEEGIGDCMYTFHPGNPVPASTFKSGELNEEGQKKAYQDGDTITVGEAKALGFKHVKAE